MNNYIAHETIDVITYTCPNLDAGLADIGWYEAQCVIQYIQWNACMYTILMYFCFVVITDYYRLYYQWIRPEEYGQIG